jgi:hypothetical protein
LFAGLYPDPAPADNFGFPPESSMKGETFTDVEAIQKRVAVVLQLIRTLAFVGSF